MKPICTFYIQKTFSSPQFCWFQTRYSLVSVNEFCLKRVACDLLLTGGSYKTCWRKHAVAPVPETVLAAAVVFSLAVRAVVSGRVALGGRAAAVRGSGWWWWAATGAGAADCLWRPPAALHAGRRLRAGSRGGSCSGRGSRGRWCWRSQPGRAAERAEGPPRGRGAGSGGGPGRGGGASSAAAPTAAGAPPGGTATAGPGLALPVAGRRLCPPSCCTGAAPGRPERPLPGRRGRRMGAGMQRRQRQRRKRRRRRRRAGKSLHRLLANLSLLRKKIEEFHDQTAEKLKK